MAFTTYTLTGDVSDFIGTDYDVSKVSIVLEASDPIITDGLTLTRFGNIRATIAAAGTFTIVGIPATTAGAPLYTVVIRWSDAGTGQARSVRVGWFEMTANANLAVKVDETIEPLLITPTIAAQIEAAAALGATNDTATASFVNDTGSATRAALDPKYVGKGQIVRRAVDYGVTADGVADDTAELQAAVDAAAAGETILLPVGNVKITAPLSITKAVTILGNGYYQSRIFAVGCNGVEVAAGVSGFRMENVSINSSVRHTVTPNTLVGIKVDGTTGSRPANHVYRDIYVDGFKTAIQTRYLWSSVFDNIRTSFGLVGLVAYGLSVNNFVGGGSQFSTGGGAGSRGITLLGQESATDTTDVASEGWVINSVLVFGAEIGVELAGVNHVIIGDSILDFNTGYGVYIRDNGTHFGANVDVHDCYIAMDGASGSAAIALANTIDNAQRRYARFTGNELVVYSGGTCPNGIILGHANSQAIVRGNTSKGFGTADFITTTSRDNIVTDNAFLSAVTYNLYSELPQIVANNTGTVYRTGADATTNYERDTLGRKLLRAGAAPTTGTWALGDRVIRDVPAVGSPKAWVCTVAGTPGTWVSEGNL